MMNGGESDGNDGDEEGCLKELEIESVWKEKNTVVSIETMMKKKKKRR